MRNNSLLPFILFLVPGCAAVAGEDMKESSEQPPPQPVAAAPEAPAPEPVTPVFVSEPAAPAGPPESDSREASRPVKRTPSKEQIQVIQELLRTAGFDPGPIDGIMGTKTTAAIVTYQSGCAVLRELLENVDMEAFRQTAELQAPPGSIGNRQPGKEQIRLIQQRLKEAGFDPGPIDGVLGAKTRAALQQYQAAHGLSNTGSLDDKTLGSLGVET